jgi:signal transduction histidine kinase
VRRQDGEVRVLHEEAQIEPLSPGCWRVAGVYTDVTDRVRAQEEREASEARRRRAEEQVSFLYREAQEAIRLHERTEETLTLMAEASGALLRSLDLEEVLASIVELARQVIAADAYAVWRTEAETGAWRIVAYQGLSPDYPRAFAPTGAQMPDHLLEIPDVAGDPLLRHRLAAYRAEGVCSLLVAPLHLQGGPAGTLTFYYRQPHAFEERERRIVMTLANLAAVAIDNARLYQEVQRTSAAKDAWLAMLAHELRNPLGAASNALHLLQLPAVGEAQKQRALAVLARQIGQQTRLVDDLLDVSRLIRGRIGLHREPVELGELVRVTVEDHRELFEEGQLTLSVDLPQESLWVDGDPTRLAQALTNLLTNASKFTDPGGRVTVSLASEADGQRAALTVRDTGVGMPAELVAGLFEPFVQADRSLERSHGGLGLGLALVKGLVELHGGEVRVASAGPGRGSEFTILLPLASPHGARHSAGEPAAAPGRVRVLIVEDSQDAADMLRDILEHSGCEVRVAYSGTAGLESAREFRPELILCDIGLPGMDGYSLARALRQDPRTASAYLAAVTGYGQEEDRRRSREAGFAVHLTKPISLPELERLLASLSRS